MTNIEFKERIHHLIPGGAHTYSKGDDQFPSNAPSGIRRGSGAWLWDINDVKYLDCSMGLGSVTLGHAYPEILDAVKKQLELGVNFQRPSLIELEAAEKFLSLIPMHDMIKFSKNGSTVTTAAVKLARAFTGRDYVAFPGDHPFYSYDDWFIGSTSCNKGVPEAIRKLSLTFKSCNIDDLKLLFASNPNKIACVILEPEKFHCGKLCSCKHTLKDYLSQVIEVCHQNGSLVIFDEMVTGFKTSFPGTSTKFNLKPDMITWGKGIANGFSCSALTGIKEVMNLGGILDIGSEKVFLMSTTHGAETHTLAALIETINIYKNKDVINEMHKKGEIFIKATSEIIDKLELSNYIKVSNSFWTPVWTFTGPSIENYDDSLYRTFFLQEMIKNKVLFQGAIVPSMSHNETENKFFFSAFESAAKSYKEVLESGGILKKLNGNIIKPVFRKYL